MPPLIALLPTIAAIGGLASAGTTIGLDIANAGGNKPPATPTTPAPTPPNAQQLLQQREVVGQQASNLESQTSGTAGPDFLKLFAPYLAGISGQPGAAAAGQFAANQNWTPANSQPTNPATGQINLSDFISTSTGG